MADDTGTRTGAATPVIDPEQPAHPGLPTAAVRRARIPSERERLSGLDAPTPVPTDVDAPARKPTGGPLRTFFRDLDPRSIPGPKLPLVLLGLSAMFARWDDVALAVLLPDMRADFAFSLQFLLTLGSVLGVVTILLSPLMGYLADRVQRVWMLRAGGLIANAASVMQGLSGSIPQLVAGRAAGGFGGAVAEPAAFPLLTDYYPSRSRARVFAFLGFAGAVGALVAPTVAGTLADRYGWRSAVIALGGLATLVTVGFFFLKEPVRGYHERREMGADEATARQQQPPVSWGEAWRAAGSVTTLRRLWYATPFLQVAWVGTALFLSLYFAEEFGLGPRARGYIATIHGIGALLGIVVAGPVADRLLAYRPGRVMIGFGGLLLLYAASVGVLAFSNTLWLSVVVGLPFAFGFVAIGPALRTLISLVVPPRIRGLGLQTIAPWQLLGLVLLPFIGRAADAWGLRQGLLTFIPVFVVGAVILMSSSAGVERDIRSASAAALAERTVARRRATGLQPMLLCRDVQVHYGGAQVLFGVDLDVEAGTTVAILGTNGAGKSTLLRAIAGVHEPSGGAIFVDGQDSTHAPPHELAARGVALVPAEDVVFADLTVAENLRMAAWTHTHDPATAQDATQQALATLPTLSTRLSQRAGSLSGGEQRLLALAMALAMRPRLLLVDELSRGLAPGAVAETIATLRRVAASGTTLLVVEQSVSVALQVAERAVFLDRGEIHHDGPTEELLQRPDLVRSLLVGRAGRAPLTARQPADHRRERLLELAKVTVNYGGVNALGGVDLSVDAGEIVGLIGPNGAGKTTLLDVASGFVAPDAGRVRLAGRDVTHLPPDARARLGLGRSFQHARLFPSLTVRDCIAVARQRQVSTSVLAALWPPSRRDEQRDTARRVADLLELLGLERYADARVKELSTGTRRAVDLACMLAMEPRLVLLDEPSSGLAEPEVIEFGTVLVRLLQETGCGMVLIEHDVRLAAAVAHRLVALDLGEVVAAGRPDDVLGHPDVVRAYLAGAAADAEAAGVAAHVTSLSDPITKE